MSLDYLTDIIYLLIAAVVLVPISRFVGLGIVPGFLLAGVAVGPSALSLIDNPSEIAHLAELGVVLLLFVVGIELKPSRLWLMRRMVFGLGALQVIVTAVLFSALAHYVFGIELRAAILIGPALALSSTAFVLQLLNEQKMLNTGYGRTSLAVLLFQDLAVVPLLALASLLTMADITIGGDVGIALLEGMAILLLVILGGRLLLQPLLRRIARLGSPEIFTATAVLLVLGTAVLMAEIGLSMAMGAFVAGLLVADSEFRHQVVAEIQPFRGLLLGLFFMSMGMSLGLQDLFEEPMLIIGVVALLMLTKVLILWPLAILFGHKDRLAPAVALILAQSGEFALVLFAVAFNNGLLQQELFQQLLLVVVLSMLATPPLAGIAYRLAASRKKGVAAEMEKPQEPAPTMVVIVGFGRVGRRVGEILTMREVAYLAVDIDAGLVNRERMAGRTVFYGDARQPDVLKSMGVAEASLIVVTVDDFQTAEQVVASLHMAFPTLDILARGHNLEHCRRLRLKGAWLTVSENLEASIALAEATLQKVTADEDASAAAIDRFRSNYYAEIEAELER